MDVVSMLHITRFGKYRLHAAVKTGFDFNKMNRFGV